MAKRHISVHDERVLRALSESKNASRLIEEAVIYYLDSFEDGYITRKDVSELLLDFLKGNAFAPMPISNPNYTESVQDIKGDIASVLDL